MKVMTLTALYVVLLVLLGARAEAMPQSAPSNLTACNVWARTIDLCWQDNSSNEDGFRVAMCTTGPTGNYTNIGITGPNVETFRVLNLQPTTTYWFKVRAYRGSTYSPYAGPIEVVTRSELPNAPSALNACNVWSTMLDLCWQDNSNNEDEFRIAMCSTGPSGNYNHIGTTPPNTQSFRVQGLQPSTTYWFKVRAANAAGYSDYSNIVQIQTSPPPVPAAPSALTACNVWTRMLDLCWQDNSSNEDEFRVAMCTTGPTGNFQNIGATAANTQSFRVQDLQPDTTYWFKVRAGLNGNYSPYAGPIEVRTRSELPSAPSALNACNVWSTRLDLCWQDNSNNEDEFRIAMCSTGPDGNFDHVGSTAANAQSFRVESLQPDTTYWFKVRAANAAGYSDYTTVVQVRTQLPPVPAAPTGLNACNVWSTRLDLCWQDNSNDEDEFRVAMCTTGPDGNFDHVGSAAANAQSFRVQQLQPETTYWFKVRAANAVTRTTRTSSRCRRILRPCPRRRATCEAIPRTRSP
jgi:chitodextrinase